MDEATSDSKTNNQRGVFPGLEFFTQLQEIAKNTTSTIYSIESSLNQPSKSQGLQVKADWSALQVRLDDASSEAARINEEHLKNRYMVSDSINTLFSCYDWIFKEGTRIEQHMKQFGFEQDENAPDFSYNKPLTPAMQAQLELEKEKQLLLEQKIKQKIAKQHLQQQQKQQKQKQKQQEEQNSTDSENSDNVNNDNSNKNSNSNKNTKTRENNKENQMYNENDSIMENKMNNNNNNDNNNENGKNEISRKVTPRIPSKRRTTGSKRKRKSLGEQLEDEREQEEQLLEMDQGLRGSSSRHSLSLSPNIDGLNGSSITPINSLKKYQEKQEKKKQTLPFSPKTPTLEDFGLSQYNTSHYRQHSSNNNYNNNSNDNNSNSSNSNDDSFLRNIEKIESKYGTKKRRIKYSDNNNNNTSGVEQDLNINGNNERNEKNNKRKTGFMNDNPYSPNFNNINSNNNNNNNNNNFNSNINMNRMIKSPTNSISVSAITPSFSKGVDDSFSKSGIDDSFEDVTTRLDLLAARYGSRNTNNTIENLTNNNGTENENENESSNESSHIFNEFASPRPIMLHNVRHSTVKKIQNCKEKERKMSPTINIISPMTENDLNGTPTYLRGQFSSIDDINTSIEKINVYLNKNNETTITKDQLSNILTNKKEKPLLLLLTMTKRLKSEWKDGVSVYKA